MTKELTHVVIGGLLLAVLLMGAIMATQHRPKCNDVIMYADHSVVCEVNLRSK